MFNKLLMRWKWFLFSHRHWFMLKTICPSCRRVRYGKGERDFIKGMGECGLCDHVRGEVEFGEQQEDYEL